ncbi:hypothetical protein [Sorangium sp. So ce861]|uniref:hypothetical protein n=1 Tax=Sorangium sp. So ce861 TaxID=3133323 RepID=UPI003F5F0438
MTQTNISPHQFLRTRHPEHFSDSVDEDTRTLDRAILDYHLESLTSRGQEHDFERFARSLAEREVCPNLLPQTGPTGGGDSKVDAETYPVAESLAATWYVGLGTEAASERWAFAFSAKKDWRAKIQSDVAKVAATNRDYKKVFFITNQYVSDKSRASVEDQLRAEHGFDVRIFDRTWILNKVFTGRHEELAITELRIGVPAKTTTRKGPLDLQRESDLAELEERITSASRENRFGIQTVADAIEAAKIARSLGRPRTETDGMFARAERLASKHGTSHQCMVIAYQKAWTSYWWHEDFDTFHKDYDATENQVRGTRNAYELELLTNLWFLLHSHVSSHQIDQDEAKLQTRTKVLTEELDRLANEKERSSTVLHARTLRLLIRLLDPDANEKNHALDALHEIVNECEGLVGYPLEPIVKIVTDLGEALADLPSYEKLFESTVRVTSTRKGDVIAAEMLLKRGLQQLDADRPYEAIRYLGRSLRKLYKHESRDDLIRALYFCGMAYKRVGLMWAARGSILNAASVATNDFWTYSIVDISQAACYNRLKWIELQLGRVPHALAWHEADRILFKALQDQGHNEESRRGENAFDAILGILLLKTDTWQLKDVTSIPDTLDRVGLPMSAIALRFALGHTENIPKELIGVAPEAQSVEDFFVLWINQPAAWDIAERPELYATRNVLLSSVVLGCRIDIDAENESPCIELAESILASLESLLSTGLAQGIIAREPSVVISIRTSDLATPPFSFELRHVSGKPCMSLLVQPFDVHHAHAELQAQIKDRLAELLAQIIGHAFYIEAMANFTVLFRDELALERAIDFTGSFGTTSNILGTSPKTNMAAWILPGNNEYAPKRSDSWFASQAGQVRSRRRAGTSSTADADKTESTIKGIPSMEVARHQDIKTVSLIREALWRDTEWTGVAFAWADDEAIPPYMALCFSDNTSADLILQQWRDELGTVDVREELRVTIVRGISVSHPHAYRVVICVNPEKAVASRDAEYLVTLAQRCTMIPSSAINLGKFLDNYGRSGRYILTYATRSPSGFSIAFDRGIEKRELYLREAWQIGISDPDMIGIYVDDDPVVPSSEADAPVHELLRWMRGSRQ